MSGTGSLDRLVHVQVASRSEWRTWLEVHHRQDASVWLVTWKKGRGPYVPYGDVRDEALCFGWIDSRPARLDMDRTMLLMSRRRPGSGWSKVNRDRVAALTALGRMAPAGMERVEAAKADGSWNALDSVDALTVPADLALALAAAPPAAERFSAFTRSARRGILEWIAGAKRETTRASRVLETARLAAQGIRANYPEARPRSLGNVAGSVIPWRSEP